MFGPYGMNEQLVLWRHGRVQAYGAEWSHRPPTVGSLLVVDATDRSPGTPRRIASVREDVREDRDCWIVEHVAVDEDRYTGHREAIGFWRDVGWPSLSEHYPICGTCRGLMPCEHAIIDKIAQYGAEKFARFSDPTACPACQEPITLRQKTITFDRNLHGIGTVSFHLRKRCLESAMSYDQLVHREDGNYQLVCPGAHYRGLDSDGTPVTYCSLPDCRGAGRRGLRGGMQVAAYLPHPDGFHRSPEVDD